MKKLLTITTAMLIATSCAKVPDDGIVIIDDIETPAPQEQPQNQPDEPEPQQEQPQDAVLKLLECPAPAGGNSMIVVNTDDEYGVNYFLEWDCDKKAQRWTAYRMHKGNTVTTVSRSDDAAWHEDERIPAEYRSTYDDYHYSGFDRGHICPSGDRLQNRNMNRQTFCYSNVHPQYNALNAFIWGDMEAKVRAWNTDSFRDTLYVVKGGTIDGQGMVFDFLTHGTEGVIIPRYFFMAILCVKNNKHKAVGFWIEHKQSYTDAESKSIKQYAVPIDRIEELTGIDFFHNLDDETETSVEREWNSSEWNF